MAASAVIGALRVNLGLNSASFRSGLKQSGNGIGKFAKVAAAGFAAVSAAATAAFAAVGGAARDADKQIKASRSLGIKVEELGRLTYAADLSGASFESLQTGIRRASQTVDQALTGMKNEGTRAFKALDVRMAKTDGSARSMYDILGDVADRFSKMPDGVEKTAMAMAMFGRSGAELIPLLNAGRDGIAAMGDEAERLGLVFSTDTALASEIFNDNLTRLNKSLTGLWNMVLANVIPNMVLLTNKFSDAVSGGTTFDSAVRGISAALNILIRGLGFAFDHLDDLYDLFKIFVAAQTVMYIATLAGAFITLAKTIRVTGVTMALLSKVTRAKVVLLFLLAAAIAKVTGKYDDMIASIKDAGDKIYDALPDALKDKIQEYGEEFEGLTASINGTDEAASESLQSYLRASKAAAGTFDPVRKSVEGVSGALVDSTEKGETFAGKMKSVFTQVGSDIRGLVDGTKSWNDVLISVLESLASVALQNLNFGGGAGGGFFGDLLSGFFGGLTGFASGGSFTVGGSGGIDSQPVAFMASPDEVVSVMTPGQQASAESGEGNGGVLGIMLAPGLKAEWLSEANQGAAKIVQPVANAVIKGSQANDGSRF